MTDTWEHNLQAPVYSAHASFEAYHLCVTTTHNDLTGIRAPMPRYEEQPSPHERSTASWEWETTKPHLRPIEPTPDARLGGSRRGLGHFYIDTHAPPPLLCNDLHKFEQSYTACGNCIFELLHIDEAKEWFRIFEGRKTKLQGKVAELANEYKNLFETSDITSGK